MFSSPGNSSLLYQFKIIPILPAGYCMYREVWKLYSSTVVCGQVWISAAFRNILSPSDTVLFFFCLNFCVLHHKGESNHICRGSGCFFTPEPHESFNSFLPLSQRFPILVLRTACREFQVCAYGMISLLATRVTGKLEGGEDIWTIVTICTYCYP